MSIERIQQAIQFMEEHICEDITYADAAKSVHMSNYNFHRMFSFVVGMTAGEYLRSRRLTLAAQELQAGDLSVIDAAYKYGYETPESFSKAFTKFHGSSPRQVKRKGAQLHLFSPLVIKIKLEGGNVMDYRMEQRGSQRFLALVKAFPNEIIEEPGNHDIPDFWTECGGSGKLEALQKLCPAGKRDLYGLCGSIADGRTHFKYGIGILMDGDAPEDYLKNGYSLWETEPADYAVFKCKGTDAECIGEVWSKFYKEFVPQTGYSQTDGADYELYFENGEPGVFCELWIPVKRG